MGGVIAGLIARYGSPVTLGGASGRQTVTALLQPLRRRGEDSNRWTWTTLGGQPQGQYLLLCVESPEGYDTAEQDGVRYWLRRWERFVVDGRTLYHWAVLTKEE